VFEINPDFQQEKINKGLAEIYEYEKDYLNCMKHYKNLYKVSKNKVECVLKIAKCCAKLD